MLRYSEHARLMMARRLIDETDVEMIVSDPTGTRPGEPGTHWVRGLGIGGRFGEVCVRNAEPDFVITAAWCAPDLGFE